MDLDGQIKYRCSVKYSAQPQQQHTVTRHCPCVNMVITTSTNKSVCTKSAAKQVKFRKDLNNNINKELLQPALKIEKISNINNKSIIADKRMAGAARERTRGKQSDNTRDKTRDNHRGEDAKTHDKPRDRSRDKTRDNDKQSGEDASIVTHELREMNEDGGWREALKFYSNVDISNLCLSDRDTKIICLMMKR